MVGTVPTILGTKVCSSREGGGTRDKETKKELMNSILFKAL